jgi:hypothetical protein
LGCPQAILAIAEASEALKLASFGKFLRLVLMPSAALPLSSSAGEKPPTKLAALR